MLNKIKPLLFIVLILLVIVLALILEAFVRSRFGGPLTINGLPISNTNVTGEWHPDFLWLGRAWTIEVQSDKNIELELDGRTYHVPPGSHRLFYNHDNTNTKAYGDQAFLGFPANVEVRAISSNNDNR